MSIDKDKLSPEAQELLAALSTVYWSLDDASGVVDAGEDEEYAYQAELEMAAGVLEKYGQHTGRIIGGEPR